jgi:hypothetical protein
MTIATLDGNAPHRVLPGSRLSPGVKGIDQTEHTFYLVARLLLGQHLTAESEHTFYLAWLTPRLLSETGRS